MSWVFPVLRYLHGIIFLTVYGHFRALKRQSIQNNVCIGLYKEIYHQTHIHMRFLSHRQDMAAAGARKQTLDSRTPVHNARGSRLFGHTCSPRHPRLPAPMLVLRPNLVPSSCLFVISNTHRLPLIKGIIIYNFLLKNQLCILSIVGRNS